jgi:hypothetical protein
MRYDEIAAKLQREEGIEQSTMMKSPCLRYKGDFIAMMFDKQDALIVKVYPARVDALSSPGTVWNSTSRRRNASNGC